jgi:hypothetical protein
MPSAAEVCPECGYDFPAPTWPQLTVSNAILLLAIPACMLGVLAFSFRLLMALGSHQSRDEYLFALAIPAGGLLISAALIVVFLRSLR